MFNYKDNQRPDHRPPTLSEYAMAKKEMEYKVCKVCGSINSKIEFDINDGKCFNCNTQL
jgi:hypothetical protein